MKRIDIKGVIVSNDVQWIYDLFGIESTSPKMVDEQIQDANGDDLEVFINSGGGEVPAGSEIYTALRDYRGKVTVKIVGWAASAASVIAMAGNKVMMSPTAQMMIHNSAWVSRGDHRQLSHDAGVLQTIDRSIARAYMLKSGMSEEELLEMMAEETWFTAEEALKKKLIDEIMFEENQPNVAASASYSQLLPQQVIDKIRNEFYPKLKAQEEKLKKEDETVENLEELKAKYPDIYQAALEEGAKNERVRIKAIDDISATIDPELVAKAKFEEPKNAEELALEALKADAAKGRKYMDEREEELENSGGEDVEAGAAEGDQEDQQSAVVDKIAASANKKRKKGELKND